MKSYKVTKINREAGARVIVREITTSITPENGWKTIKKVPGVIVEIERARTNLYYFTSSGGGSNMQTHPYSGYGYIVKLDDDIKDAAGNNIIPISTNDIKFIEKIEIEKQRKPIDLKKLMMILDDNEKQELKSLL
jgi:hydroxymethylglutaryl-CoA reductase